MYDFVGFVACVLLLFGIWNNHNNFFKHYGMQDTVTKSLNFLFLFVLLFYIYPLKYLFSFVGSSLLINVLMALDFSSPAMQIALDKTSLANMEGHEWVDLMVRFGLGLFFIYMILGSMHVNALKNKVQLELNEVEVFQTKSFIIYYFFLVLVAIASMLIVIIGGGVASTYAGFVYLSIPTVLPILRKLRLKKLKTKHGNLLPKE